MTAFSLTVPNTKQKYSISRNHYGLYCNGGRDTNHSPPSGAEVKYE
jgi:hypothetical protein